MELLDELTNFQQCVFHHEAPQGNCGYSHVRRKSRLSRPGSPFSPRVLGGILPYWLLEMTLTLTSNMPMQPKGNQVMWKAKQPPGASITDGTARVSKKKPSQESSQESHSERSPVIPCQPSRKLSAGCTEEFSTCQRKCVTAKILSISTPATTMSLSPVAIRPVQQAVVVSHVAAESDHEGFKWTQWDVWLSRFPGHPTIKKCSRRLAHPVRKSRRKEIPSSSNLVLQISLAVAIAASVIKHLKSRTGSTLASLTASATRLTRASAKFIPSVCYTSSRPGWI
jgi:hypothetical protein